MFICDLLNMLIHYTQIRQTVHIDIWNMCANLYLTIKLNTNTAKRSIFWDSLGRAPWRNVRHFEKKPKQKKNNKTNILRLLAHPPPPKTSGFSFWVFSSFFCFLDVFFGFLEVFLFYIFPSPRPLDFFGFCFFLFSRFLFLFSFFQFQFRPRSRHSFPKI